MINGINSIFKPIFLSSNITFLLEPTSIPTRNNSVISKYLEIKFIWVDKSRGIISKKPSPIPIINAVKIRIVILILSLPFSLILLFL